MIHTLLLLVSTCLTGPSTGVHPPILFGGHEYHDEPWIVIEQLDHPDVFRQLDEIPRLRALQADLEERRWNPERLQKIDIPGLITELENQTDPVTLRFIEEIGEKDAA